MKKANKQNKCRNEIDYEIDYVIARIKKIPIAAWSRQGECRKGHRRMLFSYSAEIISGEDIFKITTTPGIDSIERYPFLDEASYPAHLTIKINKRIVGKYEVTRGTEICSRLFDFTIRLAKKVDRAYESGQLPKPIEKDMKEYQRLMRKYAEFLGINLKTALLEERVNP